MPELNVQVAETIDCKGLSCPMPIVRSRKAMESLDQGEVLEVLATDRGAIKDVQAWAKQAGHELIEHREEGGVLKFYIRKGVKAAQPS